MIPDSFPDVASLEEFMTRPDARLQEFVKTLDGPLVVLGAGGKMGPTLCKLARRAADEASHPLQVIGVSRFSDKSVAEDLETNGIDTISADLLDPDAVSKLPDSHNVIYLVGMKFGTSSRPDLTWAINTMVPDYICRRYRSARIVALSTGNVYPFVDVHSGGSREVDPLDPVGEYGTACMARERIFTYHAREFGVRAAVVRLNYAVDMRYGVLLDLARKIDSGQEVDVTMGYFNCIWQGEANDKVIRTLGLIDTADASANLTNWNLTGLETLDVRTVSTRLGELMEKPVKITGVEAPMALLSDAHKLASDLGSPVISPDTMMQWTADWVSRDMPTWGKPTHFEKRSGSF